VAQTYADDGVSGTIPLHERPEGRRLLEDAREGKFSTLLVYRLDWLGRSQLVTVDAHDRLQACGVALKSATEPIDTSNPSGRLIFQMLASFAEYERETIRERTQAGLQRAYRGGKHFGAAPYGYRTDDRGFLQVVPEEAELVREIIENVAEGSTLYAEAKRLNDLGLATPGWRYGKKRPGTKLWSVMTVSNIVRQSAYSGIHKVKVNGGKDIIEQPVPPILDEPGLQKRAETTLRQNERYPDRKNDRDYLLSGLIRCAHCGGAVAGHPTGSRGKKYHYYVCRAGRTKALSKGDPHETPYVNAAWLESLVWTDVRRFLNDPGEVLERLRDELGDEGDTEELDARKAELSKRLAAKQVEKDRYVRAYAQGHISEDELSVYLADLKDQLDNLRLLLDSVEGELSQKREQAEIADSTAAWLHALQGRVADVEDGTKEAFRNRRQLVRLLVAEITVSKKPVNKETEVRITYRFGPPPASGSAGSPSQGGAFGDEVKNGSRS
jgi:site-specific DNA recombinase